MAGHCGYARFNGEFFRSDLVAHRLDGRHIGADPGNTGVFKRLGEFGVFGQETEARMDRFCTGFLCRGDDLFHHQIAVTGCRAANENSFVRHIDGLGVGIGLRIDRDRPDTETLAGFDNTHGDFTAVGNQNFLEHAAP